MAKIRLMSQSTVTLESAFDDFIRYSKAKNLSTDTIDSYEKRFKQFHFWNDGNIADINNDIILQCIEHLQEQVSAQSINTNLRHLRAIINYWAEQHYCQSVKIKMLKVSEQIKESGPFAV